MNKAGWTIVAILGVLGTFHFGRKWLQASTENKNLEGQNNDLRKKNFNVNIQNDSLKEKIAVTTEENNILKEKISTLTKPPELPPQTT